ncbi:hypothetical protein [Polynucleobacter sp. MG-27-Goln-C1]|uniref:hypothetical protein n=1 Tax=Polynucleobacter sp. MG-27-Goln-C1 TaxID=1819726 RepID=UPI001C0DE0B8|nr:hypothetical protein [Polynucleobacter sp. MG-27-Goln-C1]MBU3611454.1 hypothetical protein [Polynucleobacter sp. MG-27-Goln-C1]
MPVDLNVANSTASVVSHDHCQVVEPASLAENGKLSGNASTTHYCCAVLAILAISPAFSVSKQVDIYLQGNLSTPDSNVLESIYKPPRNYL